MFDDVAAYLVLSPIAAVVVLVLAVAAWGVRRLSPVGVRRAAKPNSQRIAE